MKAVRARTGSPAPFITTVLVRIIPSSQLDLILQYDWTGNVRELESTIERAIVISREAAPDLLQPISKMVKQKVALPPEIGDSGNLTFDEIERRAILNTLNKTKSNQTNAAKLLEIPRHVLIYRMKKLGI